MRKIIGLIGETGSGKDTVCEFIKKKYPSAFVMRFSDPLREALAIFFDEKRKEDQQWLGLALRQRFGGHIIWRALSKKIKDIKDGLIVFNGVRFFDEFGDIKKNGGKIIYITADSKTRWQRVKSRGEKKDDDVSYEKFLQIETAATEILIPQIGQAADFIIKNNGSVQEFHNEIDKVLNKI
jgi:dephospho-CoA kinase